MVMIVTMVTDKMYTVDEVSETKTVKSCSTHLPDLEDWRVYLRELFSLSL